MGATQRSELASELKERKDVETQELRRQVASQIESAGIRQVRVAMVDLNGIPRAKMVTADEFVGRVMERGHPWALPLVAVDIWQNLPDGSSPIIAPENSATGKGTAPNPNCK